MTRSFVCGRHPVPFFFLLPENYQRPGRGRVSKVTGSWRSLFMGVTMGQAVTGGQAEGWSYERRGLSISGVLAVEIFLQLVRWPRTPFLFFCL